jgi:large subunit ribosomal protein L4
MTADLYTRENKKIGTVELPDGVFGAKWNPDLVHQAVTAQLANRRQPLAHAKGRAEVRGGGRKPWRQKGTGRARHGSIRSPLWVGGGVSHGPVKTRDYEKKLNKNMRRVALFSALSKKLKDEGVKVVENLNAAEPKTKIVSTLLNNFGRNGKKGSFLIIVRTGEKNVFRAAANIPNVKAIHPNSMSVHDIIRYGTGLIDKEAVAAIGEMNGAT